MLWVWYSMGYLWGTRGYAWCIFGIVVGGASVYLGAHFAPELVCRRFATWWATFRASALSNIEIKYATHFRI